MNLIKLLIPAFALSLSLNAGAVIVSSFTGGDSGEGLDFTGNFDYAVNVGGSGGAVVGDANFTSDIVTGVNWISAEHQITNWHYASYGSTSNDNNLESVMQSIRWSSYPTTLSLGLSVNSGQNYKLQLLFSESCCYRGFDVSFEGTQMLKDFSPYVTQGAINNTSKGAVITYEFTATDNLFDISFFGDRSLYNDGNPILNAFTLEATAVPEPSILALMGLGIFGLGLSRRKMKK